MTGTSVPIISSNTCTRPASSSRANVPAKFANGPDRMMHALPSDQLAVQPGHLAIRAFDQGFHYANRNGHRPAVLVGKQPRDPDRAADRRPAIARQIENDEQVAREEWRPHRAQFSRMPDRLLKQRRIAAKPLRIETQLRPAFALRQRMDEKPSLVPGECPHVDIGAQHDQLIARA